MPFELPALPYAEDALEPYIDAVTMNVHRTKHHQAYITNLNAAVAAEPALQGLSLTDLLKNNMAAVPASAQGAVRNHGGGHANHSLFWITMAPHGSGGEPTGNVAAAIHAKYPDLPAFKAAFKAAAMGRFGSGWAWLVKKADGSVDVYSTANQDSPIMTGDVPLLGIDVWEHAYYLKYKNLRADYIDAFWNVVNWAMVEEIFNTETV